MSQQLFQSEQTQKQDSQRGTTHPSSSRNRNIAIVAIVGIVVLIAVLILVVWARSRRGETQQETAKQTESKSQTNEVDLSPEAISAAGLEIVGVTQRPAVALMKV